LARKVNKKEWKTVQTNNKINNIKKIIATVIETIESGFNIPMMPKIGDNGAKAINT